MLASWQSLLYVCVMCICASVCRVYVLNVFSFFFHTRKALKAYTHTHSLCPIYLYTLSYYSETINQMIMLWQCLAFLFLFLLFLFSIQCCSGGMCAIHCFSRNKSKTLQIVSLHRNFCANFHATIVSKQIGALYMYVLNMRMLKL